MTTPKTLPPLDVLIQVFASAVAEHVQKPTEWVPMGEWPIPREVARRAVAAGELPARRVGRSVLARRVDLDAWIARQPLASEPRPNAPKPPKRAKHEDADVERVLALASGEDRR